MGGAPLHVFEFPIGAMAMTRLVSFLMLCAVGLAIDSGLHGACAQSREVGRGGSGREDAPVQPGTTASSSTVGRDPGGRPVDNQSGSTVSQSDHRNPTGRPVETQPSVPDPVPIPAPYVDGGRCGVPTTIDGPVRGSGFVLTQNIIWGTNVTLAALASFPEYAGFDFSEEMKKRFDDQFADIYVDEMDGGLVMYVREDSRILECGPSRNERSTVFVPRKEWSSAGAVKLIPGYEYLVRTWDMHYAKFVVTAVTANRVSFDWAYQSSPMAEENFTARTPLSTTR
jgi:hypothetical protein